MSNILLLDNYLVRRRIRRHRQRKEWVKVIHMRREELGEFHHIWDDLKSDPNRFYGYLRMTQETFEYMLSKVRPALTKYNNFRKTITPEERLVVTLRYLATGSSFKTLGYSFRISNNTVGNIVHETCKVLWDSLHDMHMQFPSGRDVTSIINDFWTKWRFPNCCGSLDGKHIRIKAPACSGSMYRNYKQYFSIVLQAVVDANYKFIAIDVGAYGKESDGGIFSNSNLSRQLDNGALNVTVEKQLPDSDIVLPHFLVGDEAYPLKTYLMRPYPQRNLGPEEEIFNQRLTRARQVVECAFGILCGKWRLLLKTIEVKPDRADDIVKCACLLHNIIIDKEGVTEVTQQAVTTNIVGANRRFATLGENRSAVRAHAIRDTLKTYFSRDRTH